MGRSASSVIAVVITVCSLFLLGRSTGSLTPVAVGAAAAVAFLLTGLVGSRDEPPAMAVASLGYVAGAALAIATLGTTLVTAVGHVDAGTSMAGLVTVGWQSLLFAVAAALAAFGAFSLPRQGDVASASRAVVSTATTVTGVIALATTFAAGLWLLETLPPVEVLTDELEPAVEAVFEPEGSTPPLGSFLLLASVAGFATASLLKALPIAVFVARKRREGVRTRLGRVRARIQTASLLALLAGLVSLVLPETVWLEVRDHEDVPEEAYDLLLAVTASDTLRAVLYRVAVVAVVVVLAVWLLRRFRVEHVTGPVASLARGFGGLAVVAAVLVVGPGTIVARVSDTLPEGARPVLEEVTAEFGTFLPVMTVLFLVFAAVLVVIALIALLGAFRIVPPRTASSVLAALGIGTASLATGLLEGPSPLLFATVALAVAVWDLGSYDRRLRAEIGDGGATRRAELTHAGASLTVAAGAGAVVYVSTSVISLPSGDLASAGVASLLGTVLLLSVLRG